MNSLLQSEEVFIEILLDTVANMSPTLLGTNGVKTMKLGKSSANNHPGFSRVRSTNHIVKIKSANTHCYLSVLLK